MKPIRSLASILVVLAATATLSSQSPGNVPIAEQFTTFYLATAHSGLWKTVNDGGRLGRIGYDIYRRSPNHG